MAFTDQADFVIADTRIHGGLLAWKLGPSGHNTAGATARVFSIQAFSRSFGSANLNAAPISNQIDFEPTYGDRSALGGICPVTKGPGKAG